MIPKFMSYEEQLAKLQDNIADHHKHNPINQEDYSQLAKTWLRVLNDVFTQNEKTIKHQQEQIIKSQAQIVASKQYMATARVFTDMLMATVADGASESKHKFDTKLAESKNQIPKTRAKKAKKVETGK